ncbi:F510_1955 family glycosylhydrolase [Cellulomonas sp. S1-8]|uniref:F510_1955 family glycosylhydrolase n=1 Tax=Cellulomonas sp. S1-8 TaxID=2904790 RepID=UPI0022442F2F|nr:exo-alpha-sialidase [Cellulomonas sp. S1-8]UZN04252.1 exo-alpha-sialidase [Cellulomonas sp. S1-8]
MNRAPRRVTATAAALGLSLAVAACSPADGPGTVPGPSSAGTSDAGTTQAGGALPGAHVHGVGIDPEDGLVHLATHEGLFRYDASGPTRVGPVIDLMGFTVAGPGHFYASGHPGAGTDLPDPVGLIESTDGGETWTALSRQGESDFHALTASGARVVAFDGAALQSTDDGKVWRDLVAPVAPFAMDVSPDGSTIVVTHQAGPVRSTDAGGTWDPVADAPLLQIVDWADDRTVVGVTPDGVVAVSADAGATWDEAARVEGAPHAVAAHRRAGGSLRVVVVTEDAVLDSVDLADGFAPLAGS